jgi:hypothetical protein
VITAQWTRELGRWTLWTLWTTWTTRQDFSLLPVHLVHHVHTRVSAGFPQGLTSAHQEVTKDEICQHKIRIEIEGASDRCDSLSFAVTFLKDDRPEIMHQGIELVVGNGFFTQDQCLFEFPPVRKRPYGEGNLSGCLFIFNLLRYLFLLRYLKLDVYLPLVYHLRELWIKCMY